MGNTNIISVQTGINNDFLNDVNNNCLETCKGAINIEHEILQKCTANASCVITNQSVSTKDTITDNISNQENDIPTGVTDFMNIFNNYNEIDINTAVRNNISDIMNLTCQANSIPDIDNNFVFGRDSKGPISLSVYSSEGNQNATCTMQNLSKIQSYIAIQNNASQTNREIGPLTFVIGIIVLLMFTGAVLYFST